MLYNRFKSRPWSRLYHAIRMFALLILTALTGCDDGRIATYPVTGIVRVDSKPADGAMVIFCPVDANPEVANLRPAGKSDAFGQFNLTTFEPTDGAPAGQYKILVKWPAPTPVDDREGRQGARGPDRLRGKYYRLEQSPLTATIEEQSNELPPFELQSK